MSEEIKIWSEELDPDYENSPHEYIGEISGKGYFSMESADSDSFTGAYSIYRVYEKEDDELYESLYDVESDEDDEEEDIITKQFQKSLNEIKIKKLQEKHEKETKKLIDACWLLELGSICKPANGIS